LKRVTVFATDADSEPSHRGAGATVEVVATTAVEDNDDNLVPNGARVRSHGFLFAGCLVPAQTSSSNNFQLQDDDGAFDQIRSDYYELFGLERYVDITESVTVDVTHMYREHSRRWHPDKNPVSKAALCEAMQKKLNIAKTVLLAPKLKQEYDRELRSQRGDDSRVLWYSSWVFVAAAGAGAVCAIVAGVPVLAAAMFGSGAGVGFKVSLDPTCSGADVVREGLGGSLAGVAAACVGVSFLTTTFAQAALVGSAATFSGSTAKDTFDLAVTNGVLGETLKGSGSGLRGNEDILSVEHAKMKALQCSIGALVGGVIPVHTGSSGQVEQSARVVARMSVGATVLYMPTAVAAIGEEPSGLATAPATMSYGVDRKIH